MRKGESLEAEQARHAAAAALPGRLDAMLAKVRVLNATVRAMLDARKRLENAGGHNNGKLEQ